ncbi:hypothetical protein ABFS82_14G201100 [Erythranthe guttata]
MPMKRRRTGSSSSARSATAAASPAMGTKADATGEPPRSKILTIAYPIRLRDSDHLRIRGFLERCHYCQKRIAHNSEVFMYSNLCAFCSSDCRDRQIAIDRLAKVDGIFNNTYY